MKVLLDTSVLVAAMGEAHPAHEKSLPWLQRIKKGSDSGLVSAHSVAELYAILTTLPMKPRISPIVAYDLIQRNVFGNAGPVGHVKERRRPFEELRRALSFTGGTCKPCSGL
jgi:predicted nucleic acid-binding protein